MVLPRVSYSMKKFVLHQHKDPLRSVEEQKSSSKKSASSSSEAIPLRPTVQELEPPKTLNEGKFTSASDGEMIPTGAVLAPNVAVNVSSRKRQALDVKVESNAKKTKTSEELSCDMDQEKTSTSSTVTPDAETSKPIADMEKNDSVPMETDGFSLGFPQNLYEQEQTNVSEQLPRRSKIEIPGQVHSGVPATQTSVSESHSDDIPIAAPTKATPAASDVIESSKTLNNQIQFDKVMIETNQIRPSILTGLNALEKCCLAKRFNFL